jgi:hypothetical protein
LGSWNSFNPNTQLLGAESSGSTIGTAADKHHLGAAHKHVFCIKGKAALSFKGNSKQSKDGHEAKHDKKLPARVQK